MLEKVIEAKGKEIKTSVIHTAKRRSVSHPKRELKGVAEGIPQEK